MAWRDSQRELITANEDGNVTIWSAKDGHPIYVLSAHTGSPITQIQWLEDKQQLITCAKDKRIKVWTFPSIWYDEEQVPQSHQVVEQQLKEQKPAPQSNTTQSYLPASAEAMMCKVMNKVTAFNAANPLLGGTAPHVAEQPREFGQLQDLDQEIFGGD